MRRGQVPTDYIPPEDGLSKQELLEASGLSAKTFDTIRKAARVRGPNHGGHTHVFSHQDIVTLIHRAESGTFSDRGIPAARAWRALMAERNVEVPAKPNRRDNRRG